MEILREIFEMPPNAAINNLRVGNSSYKGGNHDLN